MTQPLLELRGVRREFPAGEETVAVLKDIDLTIEAGEMVAIVGASGSGKSTLMNVLGCLDRPSAGVYKVAGRETGRLAPDELAQLRREHFGFIFQRYHLLSDLTATGNVEVPAIYAGTDADARDERAQQLLTRLGLAERVDYRPGQLSGGQQQRVSIARALMNGGEVILADEPTGALDTQSGHEVMNILKELHAEGHTIIIVTHDMKVAENAQRIIEISDGSIIGDRRSDATPIARTRRRETGMKRGNAFSAGLGRVGEAFRMALIAMAAHRLRTFLTMLGIIIGIASVVSVVALGTGSSEQILQRISAMGTNTLDIMSGRGFGDERSARVQTLIPGDADALAQQSYVDSVTPNVSSNASLRYRNVSANGNINGVGAAFFRVRGYTIADGQAFDEAAVRRQAQDVVIDPNTRDTLFAPGIDPVGQVIFLGTFPARVIGVTEPVQSAFGNSDALNVWLPYTTVMYRILGQAHLRSITVRVDDAVPSAMAEANVTELLTRRHGTQDFFIINTDSVRQTIESTTATMTLLISAIALISLVVGGIGVMNIMLVSVTERTREIGVRMAVGARQSDIMTQFLIEAVLVCLLGGVLGILVALGLGELITRLSGPDGFSMVYSTSSMVLAFACSTLIGVVFGFLPARNAARLDPVDALARD
ncbi:MacB family efflux pump subunit [Verticiella sediminum]|uniref:Pyoverdine export ATP-binding/permease protein PvdT n=1 Tax=Verticiella sediminum TaxID=1247510 RepID=A0A556AJ44_9BURK|nr:MacB family efflux pump subunit [Verticiella sediminum]TSH92889.1 MacB family efflux pump subunit [Verticiella sediminum]